MYRTFIADGRTDYRATTLVWEAYAEIYNGVFKPYRKRYITADLYTDDGHHVDSFTDRTLVSSTEPRELLELVVPGYEFEPLSRSEQLDRVFERAKARADRFLDGA